MTDKEKEAFIAGYKAAAERARAFHPVRIESDKAHMASALEEYEKNHAS